MRNRLIDALGSSPSSPATPADKPRVTLDLLELSNLHEFVVKAYRQTQSLQDCLRQAMEQSEAQRIECRRALQNIEERMEAVEIAAGIKTTHFVTLENFLCPICREAEVADEDSRCTECAAGEAEHRSDIRNDR